MPITYIRYSSRAGIRVAKQNSSIAVTVRPPGANYQSDVDGRVLQSRRLLVESQRRAGATDLPPRPFRLPRASDRRFVLCPQRSAGPFMDILAFYPYVTKDP